MTLVDVDPSRAGVADALGVGFALPGDAADGRDLVVHTSATSAGLQRSLDLLAPEGTVVDLSWYGDTEVQPVPRRGVPLRAARRSGPARSARWPGPARPAYDAERVALALDLLRDPAYDALLTRRVPVRGPARRDAAAADGELPALCHTTHLRRRR